ncbi:MAG TPA: 30S ribosomal protein S20 [Acidobacteriota bacterium]|nr:30S ribosomal protein S20 [Acidobacteriota bacterium]
MANTKSAEKRIRQSERRRLINRRAKSQMRTQIKRFRKLLLEQKYDEARALLPGVYGVIDRTARKGVIHRNTAARYKSRLTQHLNRLAS